jgi:hypothetical protein
MENVRKEFIRCADLYSGDEFLPIDFMYTDGLFISLLTSISILSR